MLSFSTSWNSDRHTSGEEMLDEILELGFRRIELGHGIRLSLMEGILKYFERGKIEISSLHNFCPLPVEITTSSPDCYEFTSHRKEERERAIRLTLQTIDFAARFRAPYAVLHLGHVPIGNITRKLAALAESGRHLSREYVRLKVNAVKKREKLAPLYLQRSKEALQRVSEHAAENNVRLGIECRQAYEDVPSERELPALLDELEPKIFGYWHDFGHAQTKHNLGFIDHHEWLAQIAPKLIGCHLHDAKWPAADHNVPFSGTVEFDKLVPLLPRDCLIVFEMSPRRSKHEIVQAVELWKKRYGDG